MYNLPSDILTTLQQKDGSVPDISEAQDIGTKAENDGTRSAGSASTTTCSLCDQSFLTVEDQRSHIRSDLHSYNLKLKLRGLKAVSEIEFETLVKGYIPCLRHVSRPWLMLRRLGRKLIWL